MINWMLIKLLYCTGLYFIIIELPIHKLKLLSTVEHKDTDKPAKISNVSVPNWTPTTEVYPDLPHTSNMKSFVTIVNSLKILNIFVKPSFLDIYRYFGYRSVHIIYYGNLA